MGNWTRTEEGEGRELEEGKRKKKEGEEKSKSFPQTREGKEKCRCGNLQTISTIAAEKKRCPVEKKRKKCGRWE